MEYTTGSFPTILNNLTWVLNSNFPLTFPISHINIIIEEIYTKTGEKRGEMKSQQKRLHHIKKKFNASRRNTQPNVNRQVGSGDFPITIKLTQKNYTLSIITGHNSPTISFPWPVSPFIRY